MTKASFTLLSLIMLSGIEDAYAKGQTKYINAIIRAAKVAEISEELLLAVCWAESSYRAVPARLDGHTNSYGICQVKLETAQYMDKVFKHKTQATVERLEDPFINSFYAAKYLKHNLNTYDGVYKAAIDAYNKGREVDVNSEYVQKVLAAKMKWDNLNLN